jgi:hypothetical protein
MELPIGNSNNHFPPHYLPLVVRIAVVLTGPVVIIVRYGFMRRQLFQPPLVVTMQSRFIIVDED